MRLNKSDKNDAHGLAEIMRTGWLLCTELESDLARSDRAKGSRPPSEAGPLFKALVLQTLDTLARKIHEALAGADQVVEIV
jgi:hypothetical protein